MTYDKFLVWHFKDWKSTHYPTYSLDDSKELYNTYFSEEDNKILRMREFLVWTEAHNHFIETSNVSNILNLETVQLKVSNLSFVTMDEHNENEVYVVCVDDINNFIEDLIEKSL